MDDRIKKLKTPEKCEIFARNATNQNRPDLATLENNGVRHHYSAVRRLSIMKAQLGNQQRVFLNAIHHAVLVGDSA